MEETRLFRLPEKKSKLGMPPYLVTGREDLEKISKGCPIVFLTDSSVSYYQQGQSVFSEGILSNLNKNSFSSMRLIDSGSSEKGIVAEATYNFPNPKIISSDTIEYEIIYEIFRNAQLPVPVFFDRSPFMERTKINYTLDVNSKGYKRYLTKLVNLQNFLRDFKA